MIKLILSCIVFIVCLLIIYYYQSAHYKRINVNEYYSKKMVTMENKETTIPPIIIQTVKEYDVNAFFFDELIQPKMDMNPFFDFIFYDNDRIDDFLQLHFPDHVYTAYKKINPKFGACLSDFARYCIVYITGGIYMDIKSNITKPLLPLLQSYTKPDTLIVSHWRDITPQKKHVPFPRGEIQNWIFFATPRHPVLKRVIDTMIENINAGKNGTTKQFVLELTGPIMFSRVIADCLKDDTICDTIVITDKVTEYIEYTKKSWSCLGDCKKFYYDNAVHYSNVGENVVLD
jgi:mannosyltransferase OCH1-like enzyme